MLHSYNLHISTCSESHSCLPHAIILALPCGFALRSITTVHIVCVTFNLPYSYLMHTRSGMILHRIIVFLLFVLMVKSEELVLLLLLAESASDILYYHYLKQHDFGFIVHRNMTVFIIIIDVVIVIITNVKVIAVFKDGLLFL